MLKAVIHRVRQQRATLHRNDRIAARLVETDFPGAAMKPHPTPIPRRLGRADTRPHTYPLKPGKTPKRLIHYEPLGFQLSRIRNMLKLTPAAFRVMNTERTDPARGRGEDFIYGSPTDSSSIRGNLDKRFLSWSAVRHKYYPTVHVAQAITSRHYLFNSCLVGFHCFFVTVRVTRTIWPFV
ncbi:MAG: hypothetical protein Kow0099_26190 [Candidatus Abyssubacteria bacterium]